MSEPTGAPRAEQDGPEQPGAEEHGADGHPPPTSREQLATAVAAVSFVAAILGAVGFVVSYVALEPGGGQTQGLGLSLLVAFGGLGVGLVVWAQGAMPQGPHVQARDEARFGATMSESARATIAEDTSQIGRRSLLGRLLAAGLGAVGLSALVPIASLGPTDGEFRAEPDGGWAPGRRLLRPDGSPVNRDDVSLGGAIIVRPEGAPRTTAGQVMLIRLAADGQVDVGRGRADWTVAGHVAYSRLCTHMACAVGLYQVETQSLVCPCHQSAFRVSDGGTPEFGPATRPLPQLPLGLDDEGFLIATADFDRPVGTGTWDHPARVEEDAS